MKQSNSIETKQSNTQQTTDVLLITIDTLRADRVGAYGDELAQTPTMDALALEGALFLEAYAVAPLTLPSHASILTGLLPKNHQLRDNAGFALSQEVTTLAEILEDEGYQTAAFVSAYVLHPSWGLNQGFSHYPDLFHPADVSQVSAFGEAEVPGADVVNQALQWWDTTRGPRFLWLHLYEPHTPWDPPRGWSGDPYRGEVAEADLLLKRLVKAVGSDALIVLTSDHGEGLWTEGEREHGILLNEAVTRVPLIVRPPGGIHSEEQVTQSRPKEKILRPQGVDENLSLAAISNPVRAARIVGSYASGIDVAPTITSYLGIPFEADGSSLKALIEGEEHQREVYSETLVPWFYYGWKPLRMLQSSQGRLVRGDKDIWEGAGLEQPLEMSEQIDHLFGELPSAPGPLDPQVQEALMELGYLTTAVSVDFESAPDPRDKMNVVQKIQKIEQLSTEEAIPLLEDLWGKEPQLVSVAIDLSLRYAEHGDVQSALNVCEKLLERQPHQPTALLNAGLLSLVLQDLDRALGYADQLISLNALDPRGYRLKTAVFVEREDSKSVLRWGIKGIEVAPNDPNLHYLVALAFLFEAEPQKGLAYIQKSRSLGSRAGDLSLWEGVAYERLEQIDLAKKSYDEASRSMTSDLRPWVMSGLMLAKAGRCDEAKPLLINAAKRGGGRAPALQKALKLCSP